MKLLQFGVPLLLSSFLLLSFNPLAKELKFLDDKCEVKISSWERLVQTENPDDVLFIGNVKFEFKSKSYNADEVYVKNFDIQSDCIIEAKGAIVAANKSIK